MAGSDPVFDLDGNVKQGIGPHAGAKLETFAQVNLSGDGVDVASLVPVRILHGRSFLLGGCLASLPAVAPWHSQISRPDKMAWRANGAGMSN